MGALASGARRLPLHHLTIRVPWHDNGWAGTVCAQPADNTSCLVLPRIGQNRRDEVEARYAGSRLDKIPAEDFPPCIAEHVSFMAPFPITRVMRHPYTEVFPDSYRHFAPTRFCQPPYSAACIPYRWMLRKEVEGDQKKGIMGMAERLKLGYAPDREPDIWKGNGEPTDWIQERENQLALLDTFFGAIRPGESLCFFYCKRTPLSDQSRRVIVGVGRVLWVGEATEYEYSVEDPPFRSAIWERNIGHSIRPDFADGFLFPYCDALGLAEREGIDPEQFVAFAPDEYFDAYSYGSELLPHDGAVASLIACAAALYRIRERIDGPWDQVLAWVNTQINRLWHARGGFPGLGSALSAFGYEWGFQHGTLLAYEIELLRERDGGSDPWALVDVVMDDPSRLGGPTAALITPRLREGWKKLAPERRALLQLLSRCAISEEQAVRFYDKTKRQEAGIEALDAKLLENPYLLFELDRRSVHPITFGAVDRGLFPDESVRKQFPVPEPSRVDDPADARRVRALVVDILEEAAREGHTLLPRDWVIRRARERSLQPPCPLGEDVLDATEGYFGSTIERVSTQFGEPAYQVDRLAECRKIIRREILGRKGGKRHLAQYDWRTVVDSILGELPTDADERLQEERARQEKAAALEQLFCSRVSVLIGPAGTGKTTVLRMLCSIPEIQSKGVLLLAPTGKARVRLEQQTNMRGSGQTLAQFLLHWKRYAPETGAYFPSRGAPKCDSYRTVIVDESSMLTEEQLAALIDALTNVERLILVGDPRQLPPIGAGRPFVDIVRLLTPENADLRFPRCGPGYAELTIPRRQKGVQRLDMVLASHFSGQRLDPGADAVWTAPELESSRGDRIHFVQWDNVQQLHEKLVEEIVRALGLAGLDDEIGFEESLGAVRYANCPYAFFWPARDHESPGAAAKAEAWQILSPVRAGLAGVDAINRMIQMRFRPRVREAAQVQNWSRKVPRPLGPQGLLYGDKVINVINQRRWDVWPKPEAEAYIANGDIGIIVGQYKTKKFHGAPWKVEVEFAGQLGYRYGFHAEEFGEETANPLELAYCLTVHKTQGSEFGVTFVILVNPCWLLSRELLYTALTRHRDRIVVLHQGPLASYRHYANEGYSEIARRMTNLFFDPRPQKVIVGTVTRYLEDGLIHRTERGELVRSKSEVVIADKLFARGIDYAYEQPLRLPNGHVYYPDFTIADPARGVTFYWEHLGLLEDPEYRARWARKRAEYIDAGILPYQQGGGPLGTLIETCERPGTGLDAAEIAQLIDRLMLE